MDINDIDITSATFTKSKRSGDNGGSCVEVATNIPGVVLLRDSKDQGGPVLRFWDHEWRAFRGGVQDGEFEI